MSPLEIEMAIWYYTRGDKFPHQSPEHDAARSRMVAGGLLEPAGNGEWQASDGLRLYVRRLTEIQPPRRVTRWEIPGETIADRIRHLTADMRRSDEDDSVSGAAVQGWADGLESAAIDWETGR
jgi:hypothetical protein